jgi:hypothetical protein
MKYHVWLEGMWYISIYDLTYTQEAGKVMNPGANKLRWLTG